MTGSYEYFDSVSGFPGNKYRENPTHEVSQVISLTCGAPLPCLGCHLQQPMRGACGECLQILDG